MCVCVGGGGGGGVGGCRGEGVHIPLFTKSDFQDFHDPCTPKLVFPLFP